MPEIFYTASVVFLRDGEVLTVRKRGTHRYMLPGGKIEPGESALQCAVRESHEEVGAEVDPDELVLLGHWSAPAANEPGAIVDSVVHVSRAEVSPRAQAEIEDVRWLPLDGDRPDDLAPLLVDHVLPALATRPAQPDPRGSRRGG